MHNIAPSQHRPKPAQKTAVYSRVSLLCAFTLLTACAHHAPSNDALTRAATMSSEIDSWTAPPFEAATQQSVLTDLINAPQLDALVDTALEHNPGLQQTWINSQISAAQVRIEGAEKKPAVDAGVNASRSEEAHTSYESSVSISWTLDIWGKLHDAINASEKDAAQQQALYAAARDLLAADVMKAALGLVEQRTAIEIQTQRLRSLETNEQFILQRYRMGLGTLEDLDSARTNVASSRATLESQLESLAQLERTLKRLIGEIPQILQAPSDQIRNENAFDWVDYPAVALPLADLPAQTLQRRPDLRAALLGIEASELRTQVAYKDFLPSLEIGASLASVGTNPSDALMTSPVWSLLSSLTAPLYRGGALTAQAEIRELETAQAVAAYQETLLTAVQEVEDTLGLERSLEKQITHTEAALQSAENNLAQYQQRYRAGLVDILDLLSIQQQTFDLIAQKNQLIAARLSNRIDLGLALGLDAR